MARRSSSAEGALGQDAVVLHLGADRQEARGQFARRRCLAAADRRGDLGRRRRDEFLVDLRLVLPADRLVVRLVGRSPGFRRAEQSSFHQSSPSSGAPAWSTITPAELVRPDSQSVSPFWSSTLKAMKARRKPTPDGNLCPTMLVTLTVACQPVGAERSPR